MLTSPLRVSTLRIALVALVGGLLPILAATAAPAAPSAPPTELRDPAAATAAARQFHTRVGVSGQRTETTEVFANPDGSLRVTVGTQTWMRFCTGRGHTWQIG
ncbi:hypothetical protein [Longispora urticae]